MRRLDDSGEGKLDDVDDDGDVDYDDDDDNDEIANNTTNPKRSNSGETGRTIAVSEEKPDEEEKTEHRLIGIATTDCWFDVDSTVLTSGDNFKSTRRSDFMLSF